ncbi:hypothetical protein O4H61_01590 [Roseovarius aestuarii]|nr:hypothetical protein [Roseovarius aestuarii]
MKTALRHQILCLVSVIVLITGSFVSARALAPEQIDVAQAEAMLAGFTLDDICGGGPGPKHHCPFCKLLPSVDALSAPERGSQAQRVEYRCLSDQLDRGAQAKHCAHAPRAPPPIIL